MDRTGLEFHFVFAKTRAVHCHFDDIHDMENHQKISMPNFQKLKTMVKRSIDQKLRLRNSDARHGRIETGAVVKHRKGIEWR